MSFKFHANFEELRQEPLHGYLLGEWERGMPPYITTIEKERLNNTLALTSTILMLQLISMYFLKCLLSYRVWPNIAGMVFGIGFIATIVLSCLMIQHICTDPHFDNPVQILYVASNDAEKISTFKIKEYLTFRATVMKYAIAILTTQIILGLLLLTYILNVDYMYDNVYMLGVSVSLSCLIGCGLLYLGILKEDTLYYNSGKTHTSP